MTSANQHLRAIFLMAAAFAAFTVLDATAKYLVGFLGVGLVVFARYAFAVLFILPLMLRPGALGFFRTRHWFLQTVRGILLLSSTGFNFVAIQDLQLAQTSSIMFSNPLWVCALSPILLGEHVGWRRWVAVIVGFIGVLIIIRPGTVDFHPAMIYSIVSTWCVAIYQIVSRKVGGKDQAVTSLFYATLLGAFGAAPFAGVDWVMPDMAGWALLAMIGLVGAVGHFMLTQAHRMAPAPVLAPFVYTQIIWMTLAGYIVFGDIPDHWTIIGGLVVIGSGLYVFYRERQQSRKKAA
ncbi:MAG: DMT family transporter [Fimbriimonadaceae bacterium]|nr:DMT family transporter [Alphaproteobacteria bacterium]